MSSRKIIKLTKGVYRGYLPPDLPQNRPTNKIKHWWKVIGKPRVTVYPKQNPPEFADEPEYPPLNDASPEGLRGQVRLDWYETLKSLPSVDEKMYEIAKHQEHYIAHITNNLSAYDALPMAQYLTQTNLVNSLPQLYNINYSDNSTNISDTNWVSRVRDSVLSQIAIDKYESNKDHSQWISHSVRDKRINAYQEDKLVQNIMSAVKRVLAIESNPDLLDYSYDLSPAIRSWWYHSGLDAPNNKVYYKSRKDDDERINQMIQLDCSPAMNIRSNNLLEPVVTQDDALVSDVSQVADYCYPLRQYGGVYKFKWPVSLAGFWWSEPTGEFDCPHTSVLTMDGLKRQNMAKAWKVDPARIEQDALNSQAILTGFGWTNSLSYYHGFTPFNEIQYPFTCQVITTNGQDWLFNVYQLNTHTFHRDLGGRQRNNVCWSSGLMRLYSGYESGKFNDVNDDVVRLLVKFMSRKSDPDYTKQLALRPYLDADAAVKTAGEDPQKWATITKDCRRQIEQRDNKWMKNQWRLALYEHVYFRHKFTRNSLTMRKRWHIPHPKPSKLFD